MDIIKFANDNKKIIAIVIIIIVITCLFTIGKIYDNTSSFGTGIEVPPEILLKNNKLRGTILDILEKISVKYPSLSALMSKKSDDTWESINYQKYYEKVLNFAESINNWLGPEVNTAIIGSNSSGWFYAHLGCMLNRGISVGIYPTSSSDSIEYILEHSEAKLLVVDGEEQLTKLINRNLHKVKLIIYYSPITQQTLKKFTIPVVSMGNFMEERKQIISYPELKDTATIVYTSGTTGNPKGVMISHKNIMAMIYSLMDDIQNKSDYKIYVGERFVSYLPLNHILAQLMDIYIPISSMGRVWFADKDALKHSLGETLRVARPTMFIGVPRVWDKIVETIEAELGKLGIKGKLARIFGKNKILEAAGLDKCKLCITGGAPASKYARDYLYSYGLQLYDVYGMSESTGPITMSFSGQFKNNSVGKPVSSLELKIADDGEILVRGPTLFEGYYKDMDSTNNAYKLDKSTKLMWFRTGDMGRIDNDGYVYVTGRKKDILITKGGENISPQNIENSILSEIKFLNHAMVIGDDKKYLTALLVLKTRNEMADMVIQDIRDIDENIKYPEDANKSKKLLQKIQKGIDIVNSKAANNSNKIQKWIVVPNVFKIDDELTPTLKLKRNYILNKYKHLIDTMYS